MQDHDNKAVEPREELYLAGPGWWVRSSGRFASGWRGHVHVSGHFGWFDAWRIRRAVAAWARRRGYA